MLQIAAIAKNFRVGRTNIPALQGIDLALERGEFFVLLGPSGCGKTTMLRAVAGLERPDRGEIAIAGTSVFSASRGIFVPPERRPIGMVFQSYAVWPHMDVHENIAFPLREGVRRLAKGDVEERVRSVVALLGLEEMLERPVTTLSGGQQQRVALARALALQPKILLMDEPLSNLDFKLQVRLRGQIKDLMTRLGLTTLYVTHNQNEALEMGDRIAVMDRGRIVQIGTPVEIYRCPRHEFVARFIGDMNLIEGEVAAASGTTAKVRTALGELTGATPPGERFAPGERCFLGIRPEDIVLLSDGAPSGANEATGHVADARFLGEGLSYEFRAGAARLKLKTHRSEVRAGGATVRVALPAAYCILVRPSGGADATADAAEDAVPGLDARVALAPAAQ